MPEGVGYFTPEQFAAKIKAKYPQYADVPDVELTAKILQKYPAYQEMVVSGGPEVQERIRGHRAALDSSAERGAMLDEINAADPRGAARRSIPEDALILASAVPASMGVGVLGRLPGMLGKGAQLAGRGARWLGGTSAGAGTAAGLENLYRTGDPISAAKTGATVGLGLRLGGGLLSRMARGGRGAATGAAAAEAGVAARGGQAAAAAPIPPPVAPVSVGTGPTSAGRLQRMMRPTPPPIEEAYAATRARTAGDPLEAVGAMGQRPAQTSTWRGSTPQPVGGSSATGGTTAASQPKAVQKVIQSSPEGATAATPRPQAGTSGPRSSEAAQMALTERVRAGAQKLGLSPDQARQYEMVAGEVLNSRALSTVTPSGSPSQLANILVQKYGRGMGLTSPYKAQKFIDGVLKMAGVVMEPRGLGMGVK